MKHLDKENTVQIHFFSYKFGIPSGKYSSLSLCCSCCVCHIPWVINAKAHCGDTNACINTLYTCRSVHKHTHTPTNSLLIHSVFFLIWLCFPINPLWWCPDSLNFIWWDIKLSSTPTMVLPHTCGRAAPFNRCCVALEGMRLIKISH